ncbi:MAG TPA: hypothetical protein VGL61_34185 [Kofleriaceae bacterium]|jgi:hypothetical protein
MRRAALVLTLGATIAAADPSAPVDIRASGADAVLVLYALDAGSFVAMAGGATVDGRITATAGSAFDQLAARAAAVRLPAIVRGGVDVARHDAPAADVLRELADDAGVGYVIAPQHALPLVTIRARRVDPFETARAVARLANVEVVAAHGAWAIVEPGTHLAASTLGRARDRARIEINHAHPGEAQRLLEPDEPQDKNLCPPDTWIDASLHGQVGVLEAVLDTMVGPPCEQHPDLGRFDTDTASLVGVLVEPHRRRAVFRVPGGARAFEPGRGERIEINYIVVAGRTTPIRAAAPAEPAGSLADDLQLRATLHVAGRWTALLRSPAGAWRVVEAPGVAIAADSVTSGDQTFALVH